LIVDGKLRPVPAGAVGELLIGGIGLARGYRNDPQQTAARFVTVSDSPNSNVRYFRTGDFVRSSHDDVLLYLGCRDQLDDIHGFRIDLKEIESVLSAFPGIRETAAVVQGTEASNMRIAAYVGTEPNAIIGAHDLRGHAREMLSEYTVPSSIVVLSTLPRLADGTIDRARLAVGQVRGTVDARLPAASSSATEDKLLAIASDVLGLAGIGIDDNFFALGGTSLPAMRYLARISDVFNVSFGPSQLMAAPTVAAMAALIDRTGTPVVANGHEPAPAPALWRPLAIARAEGRILHADAAAIACLPEGVPGLGSLQTALNRQGGAASDPHWAGLCTLSVGNVALVVVPLHGRDLFADATATSRQVNEAIAYAARLGARTVSLTGLIAAATDLGLTLARIEDVELTTGHAATAASMGLTIRSVIAATGRNLAKARACFVGLGVGGVATLRTALRCLDHPASLLLCDVPTERGLLESLADEARTVHGFRGQIEVADMVGRLPNTAYAADLFVTATNAESVIDIDRLAPGSIVVDQSHTRSFDLDRVMRRFASRGDVLFADGGSVGLNEPINWTCALPTTMGAASRALLSQATLPAHDRIKASILSSVLPRACGLAPTIGEVTPEQCSEHWAAFQKLKVTAAPLQCGAFVPTAADLERFRAVVGNRRGARV
jgi:predicted amino acid dehydrogenase